MKKGKLYIGTSGWNYNHWRRRFYPQDLPQSKWLEFYQQHFDTVEINFSFYRLPDRKTFVKWYEGTKDNFSFAVKASRFFTHMKKMFNPAKNLVRFLENASGLSDKLAVILFQLPPYWTKNLDRLKELVEYMKTQTIVPGVRYTLEVRNDTWLSEDVFSILREYNVALTFADWPELIVTEPETADFIYIRRHGVQALYAAPYSRKDLIEDAKRIKTFLEKGKDVFVYFNNDAMAWAVKNALELKEILETLK